MKLRVSRAYVYFALGVILVGALTLIEVPCPVDGGTGVITGARGVEVTGVEAELVEHKTIDLGCGEFWDKFTYAVKISVVNETITPSYGGIVVTFYDPEGATPGYYRDTVDASGEMIHTWIPPFLGVTWQGTLLLIRIAAETEETIEETLVVGGAERGVETPNISADVAEEFACPYCGGTGKVPITEWLRIKASIQ